MTIAPSGIRINARTRYYSFLHIDDLCHTLPFAFRSVLSIAVIEGSTNPSATTRYPIVEILSFISVEITSLYYSKRDSLRKKKWNKLSLGGDMFQYVFVKSK